MNPPFEQFITFLHTADLAATADFYERILSLPLARDQGTCRLYKISANLFQRPQRVFARNPAIRRAAGLK